MLESKNIVDVFNNIYIRYYSSVCSYFYKNFNIGEAEDLTQTTFLKLWSWLSCHRSEHILSEKALVFRIARNVKNDRIRMKSNIPDICQFSEQLDICENSDFEQVVEFSVALAELSREDRELLSLKELGWSSKEIGKIMGVSASAVRSRMQNVRKRLEEILNRI